jgi:hypothetical protein
MGTHHEILSTGELLDFPHDAIPFGSIGHGTDGGFEFGRIGILRNRNQNLDIISRRSTFELRFSLANKV